MNSALNPKPPDQRAAAISPDFVTNERPHAKPYAPTSADILEAATMEHTADYGHAIVHTGTTEAGLRFVLMNDCNGNSCVSYQL